MNRKILLTLGPISGLTGFLIFFAPREFYDLIPGLSLMGPFNQHFIRDVALAFIASGAAITWGAWKRDRAVALAGAAWPLMHGLFHIQIWVMRGAPFDAIALFDFIAVIGPAVLAAWAAWRLETD